MAFEINCSTTRENTGVEKLCQDIGNLVKFLIVPYNFKMTAVNADDEEKWIEAIHASAQDRVYPFPTIFSHTDNSEDTVYEDGPVGNLFVREGKIIFQFAIESSRYKHAALKSHTNQKVGVIFIDAQARRHGVNIGGDFGGIKLQQFTVERLQMNDGAGVATKSLITMVLEDSYEFQVSPAVLANEWDTINPKSLTGLTSVELSLVSGVAALVKVEMKAKYSGIPFNADLDDMVVKNAAGVVQAITTGTSEDGVFSANFTTPLVAGVYTINLLPPASMDTKFYESTGAVEFTIT